MKASPSCKYQPQCPGCPRFGKPGLAPIARKKLERLREIWNAPEVDEVARDGKGSRFRARLSVRGKVGDLRFGIFERGSHRLVHIPECSVHHSSIERLLPVLKGILDGARIEPYDEVNHLGTLRALQLAVEPASGGIQLVLLVRDNLNDEREVPAGLSRALDEIAASSLVQGLFLGALPNKTNALTAERFLHVAGEKTFADICGGAKNYYPPGAFGQANPPMHRLAVERIHAAVPDGARVVEYYCGVGSIGLGLLDRGHEVFFNELGAGSIEGLRRGLSEISGTEARSVLAEGRAGSFVNAYGPEDVVIVDPPRKGLDTALLERLLCVAPQRLIYLSCGIDALVAESARLVSSGKYDCHFISGFAYFPFTDHVETLLVLERND